MAATKIKEGCLQPLWKISKVQRRLPAAFENSTTRGAGNLIKYRLHTRRPVAASNANGETPQIVVVSGIWVPPPPPEYAAAAAGSTLGETAAAPAGIYAPLMAAAPPRPVPRQTSVVGTQRRQVQLKQSNQYSTTCSEERGSQQSDGLGALNSNSSSTSSSSPMCLN
ncbi:transcription factor [Dionaea muscipula]